VDSYVAGHCPDHYCLLQFFITNTKRVRKTDTYCIYPTHCKIPTISKAECTIMAAQKLLRRMQQKVPTATADKLTHVGHLQESSLMSFL